MAESSLKISWITYIPVFGYFWLLKDATRQELRDDAGVILFQIAGLWLPSAVFGLSFWYMHWKVLPFFFLVLVIYMALAFLIMILVATYFETRMVSGDQYRSSGLFKALKWTTLNGLSRDEVRKRFLVNNYHELMNAIVGLVVATLIVFRFFG